MAESQSKTAKFSNPFRPGAGHMPPYLAGREEETKEFRRLLAQDTILENLILTGLRGLGKTVLLDTFKPMAIQEGWLWAGTDLSESTSITEENLAIRLLTDLSIVTSSIVVATEELPKYGLTRETVKVEIKLDFATLREIYNETPGLVADKLKAVLELVWGHLKTSGKRGIIFAYDEAQNLADHAAKEQYPLSTMLDVFQSLQRKEIPFMLALAGLPTLFPKLVEARTYAERMFRVIFLNPLSEADTVAAVKKPIEKHACPVKLSDASIATVWETSRGYPYFIQYVCREVYDVWIQSLEAGLPPSSIPVDAIIRKLDTDFFAGRWARATDRQRELLGVIAQLPNCDGEFTVQDVAECQANQSLTKPFGNSHANQMLSALSDAGLIYRNRHGKYSLAVPLLSAFIRRQAKSSSANFLF
jgi:type II secretory pathway predicted ATPase ExeA